MRLWVGGQRVPYRVWHGGADAQVDVSAYPRNGTLQVRACTGPTVPFDSIQALSLHVQVELSHLNTLLSPTHPEYETRWTQRVVYPLSHCVATPPAVRARSNRTTAAPPAPPGVWAAAWARLWEPWDWPLISLAVPLLGALAALVGFEVWLRWNPHRRNHKAFLAARGRTCDRRDRACLRGGLATVVALEITGILAILLQPAPRAVGPRGPGPAAPAYASNELVVHVHTFDQWHVVEPAPQHVELIDGAPLPCQTLPLRTHHL